jgi:hypothetical protein
LKIGSKNISAKGLLYKAAGAIETRQRRRVARKVIALNGLKVQSGPFAGMKYLPDSHGSELAPKLIGSYEVELQPIFAAWLGKPFETVVDIGCAEGYYAVGLALALPNARVFAYDINSEAQKTCRQLAAINGVASRVTVLGECTPANLQENLTGPSLVLVDCEGAEVRILRPDIATSLAAAHIIVELHDFIVPGVSRILSERFRDSHEISFIANTERNAHDWPHIRQLSESERQTAVDERRIRQEWMILAPKN